MNKYIEQNIIIEAFRKNCPNPTDLGNAQHFINIIRNIPAANVQPVVRGKWENIGSDVWKCSVCDYGIMPWNVGVNYCPNCGADMRGE